MTDKKPQVTKDGAVQLEEADLEQASGGSGDFHIKFNSAAIKFDGVGDPAVKIVDGTSNLANKFNTSVKL